MYERNDGMGWSESPWYTRATHVGACASGTMLTCVTDAAADREWKDTPIYVGGPRRCQSLPSSFIGTGCKTDSNEQGRLHCCFRTALSQAAYEAMRRRVDQGIEPGARECDSNRFSRSLLRNDTQRAVWDVQDRLCQLLVDSGPVNGDATQRSLTAAIQSFQRQRGIPTTGQVDAVTARTMGFSNDRAMQIAQLVLRTPVGTESGTQQPASLSVPLLAGAVGAAAFLAFAAYSYVTR